MTRNCRIVDRPARRVERARLQLEQSERNFKRSEELYREKLIPAELYETSKTDLFLARNAVERAQRDLAVVDEQLTKTIIKAPFDCTVLTRPISAGRRCQAPVVSAEARRS